MTHSPPDLSQLFSILITLIHDVKMLLFLAHPGSWSQLLWVFFGMGWNHQLFGLLAVHHKLKHAAAEQKIRKVGIALQKFEKCNAWLNVERMQKSYLQNGAVTD